MTAQILETDRKTIPQATQYEIDSSGFVYRKTRHLRCGEEIASHRLQLQRTHGRWNASIYTDEGVRWRFDSERLARSMFHDPDPMLTHDDIIDNFKTRPVPDFSRYVITSYGAIYCIDPPKRGLNAGQCYLVHESLKRNRAYVNLYHHDGTRKNLKVANLVKLVWEY